MAATVLLPLPRPPVRPTRSIGYSPRRILGGAHGVGHQHGNRQQAHAAGHRRVGAGNLEGLGIDVAHDRRSALGECGFALGVALEEAVELLARGQAVDAHVDRASRRACTISGVMKPGRPMAATRMSACRVIAGRSRVFEWQIVTVAF